MLICRLASLLIDFKNIFEMNLGFMANIDQKEFKVDLLENKIALNKIKVKLK